MATTEKAKKVKAVTPIGRLSYPYLGEADEGRQYSDGKFKADLFIHKDDWKKDGKDLREKILLIGRKKFGKKAKDLDSFKNPVVAVEKLSREKREKLPKEVRKDYIMIRAKSDFAPALLAADGKTELTESEVDKIKGGDHARFVVVVFPYHQSGGGVSLGLNLVQFARPGKAFGQGREELLKMIDEIEIETEDIEDDEDTEVEDDDTETEDSDESEDSDSDDDSDDDSDGDEDSSEDDETEDEDSEEEDSDEDESFDDDESFDEPEDDDEEEEKPKKKSKGKPAKVTKQSKPAKKKSRR